MTIYVVSCGAAEYGVCCFRWTWLSGARASADLPTVPTVRPTHWTPANGRDGRVDGRRSADRQRTDGRQPSPKMLQGRGPFGESHWNFGRHDCRT